MRTIRNVFLLATLVLPAGAAGAAAPDAPAAPAAAPLITPALAAEFQRIDTNEDRRISSGEHEVYARTLFDAMDRDVDYKLTVDEIMATPKKFFRHVWAGVGGILGGTELTPAEKIQRIDANHDGVVSRDEHADAARAKFREMDADNNGELTLEEFAAGG